LSEPSTIFSSMVETCLKASGITPLRVTPSWRPAKVSTAEPSSTGAARTPGSDSTNSSFCR
jgi:hypothetical protein